ncbi:unnamed protein product [Danaus chrysippus]|uniref:(African queen) hypothetical protein n=1 Tax=Danaus chrysippus TaxID=151541 RepID=A0A8J2M9F1_9NEOP|nr:unnamed protein product [Danaus chrysippus]
MVAGCEVRGRRVPAATAVAASVNTSQHLNITGPGRSKRPNLTIASHRLADTPIPEPQTFTFVERYSSRTPHYDESEGFHCFSHSMYLQSHQPVVPILAQI